MANGPRKKLGSDVKGQVVHLKATGLSGATIAKQLGISEGAVSGILAEAREALNAGQAPPAEPSSPPTPGSAPLPEEAREAIGELSAADAIHESLRRRLKRLGERVDDELRKPQPDWSLAQKLLGAERQVRDEVLRTRPPTIRKPEDDPAHVEAARIVVATLRARVEAGRRARGIV